MVPSFPIPNAPGVEGVGSGEVRVGRLTVTEMSNEEILNYLRCEMELGTAPFIEQGAGLILSSSRLENTDVTDTSFSPWKWGRAVAQYRSFVVSFNAYCSKSSRFVVSTSWKTEELGKLVNSLLFSHVTNFCTHAFNNFKFNQHFAIPSSEESLFDSMNLDDAITEGPIFRKPFRHTIRQPLPCRYHIQVVHLGRLSIDFLPPAST